MATYVFPPPLSGMTKHHARQLDPGTWALRLGLGVGMGSWNLCLRDSECLVASVSQVTQVRPSWREPGWTMNTTVSITLRLATWRHPVRALLCPGACFHLDY